MTVAAALADLPPQPGLLSAPDMTAAHLETRFGSIRVDPDRLLFFPAGMPGFPGCQRFQLERLTGGGLLLLQSVDDSEVGFFVIPLAEQGGLIRRADLIAACRLVSVDPLCTEFLAIVTARRGPGGLELLANLRAPVLIDTRRQLGIQVVLADASYPLRHPVMASN